MVSIVCIINKIYIPHLIAKFSFMFTPTRTCMVSHREIAEADDLYQVLFLKKWRTRRPRTHAHALSGHCNCRWRIEQNKISVWHGRPWPTCERASQHPKMAFYESCHELYQEGGWKETLKFKTKTYNPASVCNMISWPHQKCSFGYIARP